jgi:uncharacterized protein YndB with AHSA1/START domain
MAEHELTLTRILDAPREKVWRCWTEPALMVQWFTPKPWTTMRAEVDVRPGGSSLVVMRSPEGKEFPNPGVYLEVVRPERLVFTDAYTRAWEPSARPFFTGILTFEDTGAGKTRYTARALHWSAETKAEHERMGFLQGWSTCADQLVEIARKL